MFVSDSEIQLHVCIVCVLCVCGMWVSLIQHVHIHTHTYCVCTCIYGVCIYGVYGMCYV